MDVIKTPEPPLDRDIDSDVYVLVGLVIAHSQNANLCYVFSEPLFACSLEFHRTLQIITRTLREVENRERVCGTITLISVASARWVAVRPLWKY